jgi:PAS domain S-box-containing protein
MAGVQTKQGSGNGEPPGTSHGPESAAAYRLMLERVPALVWSTDRELRFTSSSGAGLVGLGLRPGQLVGKTLYDYFERHDATFPPIAAHLAALDGHASDFEQLWNERTFQCHVEPLWDDAGACLGTIGVATDVTDARRAEIALRERDEELRRAQRLGAIGRLAGGVAHDFANVLQTMLGYAQRLAWTLPDGDPRRADADQIIEAGERATALTRQLLAFGRRQVLRPEVIDLGLLVQEMRPLLERVLGPQVHLEVQARAGCGQVLADPTQVEQVLTNLALNAADAMPEGGNLTIEVTPTAITPAAPSSDIAPGSYVVLSLRDTGRGMDDFARVTVFDPFCGPKGEGRGPGLGLASIYGIVKQSQGHIIVESEPGKGSLFKVFLPAAAPAQAADATATAPSDLAGAETILLVDDEPGVRRFVRRSLEEYGYRVLEAGAVEEALSLGQSYPGLIHLLLTDVVLPGMNGPQLAARLAPLRPEMRILYMTGHADDAVVHRGVLSAGQALLVKPFTPLGLAHEVRKVLRN